MKDISPFQTQQEQTDPSGKETLAGMNKGAHDRSHFRGFSLANLLQMLQMEMVTCILDVNAGQKAGRLYLVGGKLVNAECGTLKGEAAVYEMVWWPRPNVDIEPLIGPTPKTIDSSLTHLLLEAFRLKDETGREKGAFPGASGELELEVL